MIFSISLLEIINVVVCEGCVLDQNIFLWIAASVAAAAAVNPIGINTRLASDFSRFFIKSGPVFNNGPKSLPKISPDFPILSN